MLYQTPLYMLRDRAMYKLPTEIVLSIIEQLELRDYPALILGAFELLRRHGLVPEVPGLYLQVLRHTRQRIRNPHSQPNIGSLPPELRWHFIQYMGANDRISFIWATWNFFSWESYLPGESSPAIEARLSELSGATPP